MSYVKKIKGFTKRVSNQDFLIKARWAIENEVGPQVDVYEDQEESTDFFNDESVMGVNKKTH